VKKLLVATLVTAMTFAASAAAVAQEAPAGDWKPVLTVAFAGYDEVMADIAFLGKLADNPSLADGVSAMVQMFTQGQGLAGIDGRGPWGMVLRTNGQEFVTLAFVPVTDMEKVLGLLATQGITAEKNEQGVYQIQTPARMLYAQQKGPWAYIADQASTLDNVPANPMGLLGGLHQRYDIAIRASIQNIPPLFRQMAAAQLQMGMEAGMERMPGETDEQYAARTNLAKQAAGRITTLINELDQLLLGWAIDREKGVSHLDIGVTAVAGTKTAEQFAQLKQASTNFAGFDLPGAAVTGNWAGRLTDADVEQYKLVLTSLRQSAQKELEKEELPEEDAKLASDLLNQLLDVAVATVERKEVDGGMVVLMGPSQFEAAVGGVVAEGAKLEDTIKRLVAALAEDEPDVREMITLDAETYKGVNFHAITVPLPEDAEQSAIDLFGRNVNAVLGISEQSVYLAAGQDPAATLKRVIDASAAQQGKQILPMRLSVSVRPILEFVGAMGDDPQTQQMARMLSGVLAQGNGEDHVTLSTRPVPGGMLTRLEVEGGLLRLMTMLPQLMGGQSGPGGPGADPFGGPAEMEEAPAMQGADPFN